MSINTNSAQIAIAVIPLFQSKGKLSIFFFFAHVNQVNLHSSPMKQAACCVHALVQFYSSTPTAYTLTFRSNFCGTPMFI